jgi:formylglycine-generating enzyme
VKWADGYRLPTEAEWEKAARGGLIAQRFPWGNTISESQANHFCNSFLYPYDLGIIGYNSTYSSGFQPWTSPANGFPPNGYGIYDMSGNVDQWCWDWYGNYGNGSQTDPRGPASGNFRVFRGGNWGDNGYLCRTASHSGGSPVASSGGDLGFRSVLPMSQ